MRKAYKMINRFLARVPSLQALDKQRLVQELARLPYFTLEELFSLLKRVQIAPEIDQFLASTSKEEAEYSRQYTLYSIAMAVCNQNRRGKKALGLAMRTLKARVESGSGLTNQGWRSLL